MIEFTTLEDYLKAGLGFTDIFEREVFNYLMGRDGIMFYDPVKNFMCDVNKVPVFFVEQEYKSAH